jgi:hypothetical protein
MGLITSAEAERSTVGPAFCGAVFASLAVMVHEVYTVFLGHCVTSDPFTHVLLEMAVFGSGGALSFAAVAHVRRRFRRTSSAQVVAKALR